MSVNFLLDSAETSTWEEFLPSKIFKGITTNPTLIKRAGQKCTISNLKYLAKEAERLGSKELHIQAWGSNENDLTNCGLTLGGLKTESMKVYVKIPITWTGIMASKNLIASSIPVTFTACYEIKQVLLADTLGASYIAPYLGRIDDIRGNGNREIVAMQKTLNGVKSSCRILAASIRNCNDIYLLAQNGVKDFTISSKLAKDLFYSSNTNKASKDFEEDAMLST